MSEQTSIPVDLPALPKGGGAIQSIGNGLGPIGSSGAASCEIPLPVSPGRGYAPALALSYSSAQGNGVFGLGWKLSLPTVTRHTRLGVPAYTHDDLFVGPSGEIWMPERDKTTGAIKSSHKMCSDGKQRVQHAVVRYRPRSRSCLRFDRTLVQRHEQTGLLADTQRRRQPTLVRKNTVGTSRRSRSHQYG